MGKRNRKRERERRKALERQQRMIAAAKRRRRNQIIAGVTVAALAVGGVATAIVVSAVNASDKGDVTELPTGDADTSASEDVLPSDETLESNPRATYAAVPDASIAEDREWTGQMATSVGEIGFTLDGVKAPQATANFVQLARDGYFDATSCHRVTTDSIFVLQCGSVTGDGTDNPGYGFGPIENVPEGGVYPKGTIAMANSGAEDSQGSQFFIVYEETTLPPSYSVFGHVTSGLEAVTEVAAAGTQDGSTDGRPVTTVTIERIDLQ